MSREILFRGKMESVKKFVRGDLIRQKDYFGDILTRILQITGNGTWAEYDVDPETVCQYTGFHDCTKWEQLSDDEKNEFLHEWNCKKERCNTKEDWKGKRIFEGDIVDIPYSKKHGLPAEVCYTNGSFCIKRNGYVPISLEDSESWCRVIGNIFDNSEFLNK